MSLGERLKEERARLGFSQPDFAALVDASKRTMIGWEQGRSSPSGEALSIWAGIGVDVMYVLTGQRTSIEYSLNRKEEALLDNYRHCVAEDQKAIYQVALSAAKKEEQDVLKKSG
ncbi:helix-turn-helix domain-containing protein [Thalassolituus oleivorans]|uniref:helix-turn-helix domain-containing protein n=1 Tax=Thalassolituus oleivorans TaxID=187493 RepID=UPI0023F107C5|nr:helix-turn-helix domain-containing protein [Thalassolituus oleivorans]